MSFTPEHLNLVLCLINLNPCTLKTRGFRYFKATHMYSQNEKQPQLTPAITNCPFAAPSQELRNGKCRQTHLSHRELRAMSHHPGASSVLLEHTTQDQHILLKTHQAHALLRGKKPTDTAGMRLVHQEQQLCSYQQNQVIALVLNKLHALSNAPLCKKSGSSPIAFPVLLPEILRGRDAPDVPPGSSGKEAAVSFGVSPPGMSSWHRVISQG